MRRIALRARTVVDGITPLRYTFVDDEDYERIKRLGLKVYCSSRTYGKQRTVVRYAATSFMGKMILLHRFLTGAADGETVDHINHDTLDNQRSNLRLCTQAENNRNRFKGQKSSRFVGVTRTVTRTGRTRYAARVHADGQHHFLGNYDSEEQAAGAYDRFVEFLWGPQSTLNFPTEEVSVVNMRPWLKAMGVDSAFQITGDDPPIAVRIIHPNKPVGTTKAFEEHPQ